MYSKINDIHMKAGEVMDFKGKIKSRRLQLGLTLEDVAKAVGVSAPTIQRYESGEIKNVGKDKIKALADALQVTPTFLMGWEEVPERKQSFDYFIEMQMHLLGYEFIYDEEDAYLFLKAGDKVFEIYETDVEQLRHDMRQFLKYRLHQIMENSKEIKK
jgi:transcriptional regulator with XRE-family HTH domain